MTGIVFVPPFALAAFALCLLVVAQIANAGPDSHVGGLYRPKPTRHVHPCWREYPPQVLSEAAADASRQIARARALLATADALAAHYAWPLDQRVRELVAA